MTRRNSPETGSLSPLSSSALCISRYARLTSPPDRFPPVADLPAPSLHCLSARLLYRQNSSNNNNNSHRSNKNRSNKHHNNNISNSSNNNHSSILNYISMQIMSIVPFYHGVCSDQFCYRGRGHLLPVHGADLVIVLFDLFQQTVADLLW